MGLEDSTRQRLGERVGDVLGGRHVLDDDVRLLDELADEEVAASDVLRLGVEHRVVREVDAARAVHEERDGLLGEPDFAENTVKVNGLTRRERRQSVSFFARRPY